MCAVAGDFGVHFLDACAQLLQAQAAAADPGQSPPRSGPCFLQGAGEGVAATFASAPAHTADPSSFDLQRILLMPPVYAILSFFSYRYYTNYTYWEFGTVAYESLVVSCAALRRRRVIATALPRAHAADCPLLPRSWPPSSCSCSNSLASRTRNNARSCWRRRSTRSRSRSVSSVTAPPSPTSSTRTS